MILAGQMNLWFQGPPRTANYRNRDGTPASPLRPLLGETHSRDWAARRKELRALKRATRDKTGAGFVVGLQWIQPYDRIDSNIGGWLFHAVRHVAPSMRWFIFYDPVLALKQRGYPVDLTRAEALELIDSDVSYLSRWAHHPQYLRLDGRPVVMVWACGVLASADLCCLQFEDGGWYVMADLLGSPYSDGDLTARFGRVADVACGFVSKMPNAPKRESTTTAVNRVVAESDRFRQLGFRVMPSTSLLYDDTFSEDGKGLQTLARSRTEIEEAVYLLAEQPRADDLLWLGTYDNWPEATTLLHTEKHGPRYLRPLADGLPPHAGNYRRDHLSAVAKVWEDVA